MTKENQIQGRLPLAGLGVSIRDLPNQSFLSALFRLAQQQTYTETSENAHWQATPLTPWSGGLERYKTTCRAMAIEDVRTPWMSVAPWQIYLEVREERHRFFKDEENLPPLITSQTQIAKLLKNISASDKSEFMRRWDRYEDVSDIIQDETFGAQRTAWARSHDLRL